MELHGPSNDGQQQKEGLGVCKRGEACRTKHLSSCWGFHIKDLKSVPSAYAKRADFFQSPVKRINTTMLTYGQLDDLVKHDIWGDVEIEDEVLEGKEQS